MKPDIRRWVLLLALAGACLGLPACGGGDGGETVTGDSPEGIPVDSALEEEASEAGGVPLDGSGVEPNELAPDESLTDGQ